MINNTKDPYNDVNDLLLLHSRKRFIHSFGVAPKDLTKQVCFIELTQIAVPKLVFIVKPAVNQRMNRSGVETRDEAT